MGEGVSAAAWLATVRRHGPATWVEIRGHLYRVRADDRLEIEDWTAPAVRRRARARAVRVLRLAATWLALIGGALLWARAC